MNHIVIMAGGVGSRFWPLSTPEYPKQFIDILGCGRSLIQLTVDRFQGICPPENFWVVTNAAYVDIVRAQLPDVPAAHILAEPAARNTAPCIAWACWSIRREDPSANVVVTPADAVAMYVPEFRRVIGNALEFTASRAAIVTIGINPTRPETGYGYIEAGGLVDGEIQAVKAFKEKPSMDVAESYLAAGNFLWNAGIFVWNVETILACLRRYKPGIAADMDRIMESGDVAGIFPSCEKISIDFAVMEPASLDDLVYTHPASFGWSDLGNWASLHDKLALDAAGNGAVGPVHLYECSDCVVHAEDASKVVLQGLDGYIVSLKDGRLLVCKRSEEQRIRTFSKD
ncbi:MAG: mannose-1-phosphate guanylyltransferase [Bacteroidales bacterium]|nr:mannose-1-phosphate guanylyltransferase [Bacteroidales bacterium]